MVILLAFMLIITGVFVFVSAYNQKYIKSSVAGLFPTGLMIMLVANTIYQVHMGGLGQDWINNNRTLYDFILNIRFSFSAIRQISLVGELLILLSIILMTNMALIKKNVWVFFQIFFLIIYYAINSPDILYKLYLSINTPGGHIALVARNIYYTMYCVKIFIVMFVFLSPFAICIWKYFKHTFSIIKRNVLYFASAMGLLELIVIISVNTKYIHSFFELNLTIFYSDSYAGLVTEKVISAILVIFVLLIFGIIFKSRLFSKDYLEIELFNIYDGSKKLDKTLRMVLHTYKNMFLAINQLSRTALVTSEKNPDDESIPFVSSIQDISKDALYNITHLLNMLTNVDITPQPLDVREIIDSAVAKADSGNDISTVTDCPKGKYMINSDSLYMTDLVYNIYKNSVDAVEGRENPKIKIKVASEDKWLLIEITDNGNGIPKDIKKQIFKPLISSKQGSKNWGIGLYYARKIVKAHNGHIFVESKENTYTKFEIFLPLTKITEQSVQEA